MNHMSLAEAIQWQAQLAIDRGITVIYSSRKLKAIENEEWSKILD